MTEKKDQGPSPQEALKTLLKRSAQLIVDTYHDDDEQARKIIADEFAKRGCHIVEPVKREDK